MVGGGRFSLIGIKHLPRKLGRKVLDPEFVKHDLVTCECHINISDLLSTVDNINKHNIRLTCLEEVIHVPLYSSSNP